LRRRGAGRYSVIDPDGSVLYYPPGLGRSLRVEARSPGGQRRVAMRGVPVRAR